MKTRTVNLTKEEIETLIEYHGVNIINNIPDRIERLSYLNKRLKAFDKLDVAEEKKVATASAWG